MESKDSARTAETRFSDDKQARLIRLSSLRNHQGWADYMDLMDRELYEVVKALIDNDPRMPRAKTNEYYQGAATAIRNAMLIIDIEIEDLSNQANSAARPRTKPASSRPPSFSGVAVDLIDKKIQDAKEREVTENE